MNISPDGITFICEHEGFKPLPYVDPASGGEPITIGFGSTHYPDGTKVTMQDAAITREYAKECVAHHVATIIEPVLNALPIALNQNQFDSLCSFCYNERVSNFNSSNLKAKIEVNPNDETIREEFDRWVYGNHKVMPGLVTRRKDESALYFS